MDEGKISMTETDWEMDYIICYGEIISSDSSEHVSLSKR